MKNAVSRADDAFLCPPRVIQEAKNDKKPLKWLKTGTVAVVEVNKSMSIAGISETDNEVIALAAEKGWSILSEDLLLRQKAEESFRTTFMRAMKKPKEKARKLRVARLYQRGRKTLRQCAEMLGTDVEGMIDILHELDIPLEVETSTVHQETLKMLRDVRKKKSLPLAA